MKTPFKATCLGCYLILGLASCNYGQAYFLDHSGANDPVLEGFNSFSNPSWQTVSVTNDLGYNAWATTVNRSSGTYFAIVAPSLVANNWTLAVNMRVATPGIINQSASFDAVVNQGLAAFYLYFRAAPSGNQLVTINNYPAITLPGGLTYHEYRLEYDSPTGLASLWVDGIMRIGDISADQYYPPPQNPQGGWSWGGATQFPTTHQANWNLVSLEVIPEPNSLSLLFLGSGVLFWLRCRK